MYKKQFRKLIVGQQVELKVVEAEEGRVIVSYNGQLMRVANKTGQTFVKDQKIYLRVKRVKPLEFALPSDKGFNVWV